MAEARTFRVFDDKGYVGELLAPARFLDSRSKKTIRLDDGRQVEVNAEDLKVRPDGSFQLRSTALQGRAEPAAANTAPIEPPPPPAAPVSGAATTAAAPNPRNMASVPSGVTGSSDEFYEHDYQIERVAVGRILDGPVSQRQEGDTLILPVVEEVLVCEKKMVLKEEIRITTRRTPVGEVRRIPAMAANQSGD